MKRTKRERAAGKPTIATVAAAAGVAVSTVSRYLNGHYVSGPVRERLSKVIASLGYARSETARNLSLGRRGTIGVVVDWSHDPWFVQLLTGIEEELAARSTGLMLGSLELRGRYDPSIVLGWIRERRIDGLILAKPQRRERPLIRACVDADLPVVTIAPDEIVTRAHVVRCDNVSAGATVAEYLYGLGHRRVAFAGGPDHSVDSRHRLQGLREGLAARGVPLRPDWAFSCGSWDVPAGSAFAERFLGAPPDVTALVLANDALSFGFLRVAHQRGVRVPGDLSVVGFDGLPQGELLYRALTTMRQPMREMGRMACMRLFEEPAETPVRTELTMDLVVRETAGPAAPQSAVRRELRLVPGADRPDALGV
jgi:LacI family transcriptional regulator